MEIYQQIVSVYVEEKVWTPRQSRDIVALCKRLWSTSQERAAEWQNYGAKDSAMKAWWCIPYALPSFFIVENLDMKMNNF